MIYSKDWTGNSASVFKTLGASNHTDHERQCEDYYATEPKATEWLCRIEKFDGRILIASCINKARLKIGDFVEIKDKVK